MEGGRGRQVARSLLSAAIAAVILFFLVRGLIRGWENAGVNDWGVRPGWLALAVVVLVPYFFLAAWIWQRILLTLGERVSLGAAARTWYLSQMAKYIPGKVWFAMGRIMLCRKIGVGALTTSVGTLLEIVLVILGGGLLLVLSLPLWPVPRRLEMLLVPAGIGALLLFLHPALFRLFLRGVTRLLRREMIPYSPAWRDLLLFVGLYGLTWIFYGLGLDLLTRAIVLEGVDLTVRQGPLSRILFFSGAAAAAWTVGFLSFFTPSGLGVREATLGYTLSFFLPAPFPVLVALLARIWITVGELGSVVASRWLGRSKHEG
jgi:uncharacterized membrane protein YbhN (UPF0104 family)